MLAHRLNQRREDLGMSCAVLAQVTGLSLRTVQRVLSGDEHDPGIRTVTALAQAMGISLELRDEVDLNTFRLRRAQRKADQLVGMVRATSALEAQAVHGDAAKALHDRTVRDLLAGSNRKLWAD